MVASIRRRPVTDPHESIFDGRSGRRLEEPRPTVRKWVDYAHFHDMRTDCEPQRQRCISYLDSHRSLSLHSHPVRCLNIKISPSTHPTWTCLRISFPTFPTFVLVNRHPSRCLCLRRHSTPTTERLDTTSSGGRPCDYERGNHGWKDECSRAALEGIHSFHGRRTCDAVFILARLRWLHYLLAQHLGVALSLGGYLEQPALSAGTGRNGHNEKIR